MNMIISGGLSNKAVKLSFILQKRRKYTIDKTREELEKEYAESCEKLKQYQHKVYKLENWIKYYDKKNMRKRIRRLIICSAAAENIIPQIHNMTVKVLMNQW